MNNYLNGMGMNSPMQNYNNMYYRSSIPAPQESTIKGNTIWVQGYEGASAFRMEPNSLFVLLEDNLEKMYIKSTDNIGMCNGLRRFKIIEEKDDVKQSTSADLNEYVRKDELQTLLLSLFPKQEEKEVIVKIAQDKIESLQNQVNQLQLAQAVTGVVRYPMQSTYCSGANPFCACAGV